MCALPRYPYEWQYRFSCFSQGGGAPLPVLAALEATRGSGPSPLLGKPVCAPGTPCDDVYGVANFKIVEK